jgi:DNA polymerase IV
VTDLGRYAWDIARELRARIFTATGLTCSAGVAPNKMLAKIASDWRKPNGQFAILPDEVEAFMRKLPVRKIWGVGPKSADKFASLGIHICEDLQQYSLASLVGRFGRWGRDLYYLCRGLDDRPVEPNRIRKSLSNECTYSENLASLSACRSAIDALIRELEDELQLKASQRQIRKAFVQVKFSDFVHTTKECLSSHPTREIFHALLNEAYERGGKSVRLLGVGVRFEEKKEEPLQDLMSFN